MVCFIWNFNNADCPPPERPVNVPIESKWCGGCDGGHWIEFIPDGQEYHFKVYHDFTGELLMDGIFLPENKDVVLNKSNWEEQIVYYTHDIDSSVYILINDSLSVSKLICQYPPFGGEDWDIIKEKHSLHFLQDSLNTH